MVARKQSTSTGTAPYLYSIDAGNGTGKGMSSETSLPITVEPVIAPLTEKRGLSEEAEHPEFSLTQNGKTLVFGVKDVFEHGKRDSIRRLSSIERYTSADWFALIDVLFLHIFAGRRGAAEFAPTGIISLPVSVYNDKTIVDQVKANLLGKHEISDYEGCTLRIELDPKRLMIMPESAGAMFHFVYDPKTLAARKQASATGTTLLIDIGYETTDLSLFEGMSYQRDRSFTITRAGMGTVARQIQEYASQLVGHVDVSRVDVGLRALAGLTSDLKQIEVAPGVYVDVSSVYDYEVEMLANRIADDVRTRYAKSITRALLGGGGAYHLAKKLRKLLPYQIIEIVPDADLANVWGAFTFLSMKAQGKAD